MFRATTKKLHAQFGALRQWKHRIALEYRAERQRIAWANDAFVAWAEQGPIINYPLRTIHMSAQLSAPRSSAGFAVREPFNYFATQTQALGWTLAPRIEAFTQPPSVIADCNIAGETFILSTSVAINGYSTLCLFSPAGTRIAAAALSKRSDGSFSCANIATAEWSRRRGYATLLARCFMPLTGHPAHFDIMHIVSSNPLFETVLSSYQARDDQDFTEDPTLHQSVHTFLGRPANRIQFKASPTAEQRIARDKIPDLSLRVYFD